MRCAKAGKHVLCEKPLAVTPAEVKEMIAVCKQHKVLLMEAFMYRCHPATSLIYTTVHSGVIGELRHIRSSFCFDMSDPSNVRLNPTLHGGVLMDVGCYCVNFSRYLVGTEPVEVTALAEVGSTSGVDEVFSGILGFPDGVHAQFYVSFRGHAYRSTEVMGTKGVIRIENPWFGTGGEYFEVISARDSKKISYPEGDYYRIQLERFGHAVRGLAALPFEPEDALDNARTIAALLQSARTGCTLRISPS